jgi:mRNA-degrading endonuclease RelE of RelBE toxin-antitoxin system
MGLGFLSANRAFYQPETKVLMVTICSLNKKAGGSSKYDETQALASKLVRTRDDLLKARREAFDLLFSGQIKWHGIPLGNLKYNKELRLGRDFGGNIEDVKYLPAIYRYDGRFYTALGRDGRDKLLRSKHHVLIMSGLYGLVTPAEPIQLYSMPIERGSKVQEIWKRNKVLTRVLVEYTQLNRIKRIFDFTARSDYRELIDWDFVANATGAEVLYCFSVMGGGEDALIPFAKFMKNFALAASEEELLAIKPETEIEDVLIRDVPYTRADLPSKERERILHANREIPLAPIPVEKIPDELEIGRPSDIKESGNWLISFTPSFQKSLSSIGDKKMEGRILEAIAKLSCNPTALIGDTNKPLSGSLKGMWRYRIGDYRLIHKPDHDKRVLYIILIHPRGKVYESLEKT